MTEAPTLTATFCIVGVMILVLMLWLAAAIRIIPEGKGMAIYRLGRFLREQGPGLIILIPFIDRGILFDTKDKVTKAQALETAYGVIGKTQTRVHTDGTVEIDGRTWNAVSAQPIQPGRRVRVTKVILEVESI